MRTRQKKEAVLNLEQQKKQARELLRAVRAYASAPASLDGSGGSDDPAGDGAA
jgi:hypothetical protein